MRDPISFAVVGLQDVGKTRLVTRMIGLLQQRGLQVALLKHDGHAAAGAAPTWIRSGSDTALAAEAGAAITAIAGGGQSLAHILRQPATEDVDAQARWLQTVAAASGIRLDIVIAEGWKESDWPKIAVLRTPAHVTWLREACLCNVIAVSMPSGFRSLADPGWRVYDEDDTLGLLTHVLSNLH